MRIPGVVLTTQSFRTARTTGNTPLPESPDQCIRQSLSDPMRNLEKSNTDESSIFSGLHSLNNGKGADKDVDDCEPPVVSIQGANVGGNSERNLESKPSKHSSIKKFATRESADSCNLSEEEQNKRGSISVDRSSGSATGSEKSAMRRMKALVDKSSSSTDYEHEAGRTCTLKPIYMYDQDVDTMSSGSVNEFQRSNGVLKLVSDLQMLGYPTSESKSEEEILDQLSPPTPEGAEGITSLFKNFERELDANLSTMADEHDADENDSSSAHQDFLRQSVQSDDRDRLQSYTKSQVKELQRLLQKTRKEVEILRDSNDQLTSEIEQTEEEHKSEMKMVEERSKQKLFELKAMHQEEMDSLTQEKDAAMEEAGWQATQYAESGRKQISSLKKQIERLKLHTIEAVKKSVTEAAAMVKAKKDDEIVTRIEAERKSFKIYIDQLRKEHERELQSAVVQAVATVTLKMSEEHKQDTDNMSGKIRSADENKALTDEENIDLLRKDEDMFKALISVKENLIRRYPVQMESLREKTRHTSNSRVLLATDDHVESHLEIIFKEVIEAFAYLLEEGEQNLAAAQAEVVTERVKKERSEVQARRELIANHREELQSQASQFNARIVQLEQDLKSVSVEKRALFERFRRDAEHHRREVQRLNGNIQELVKASKVRNPFESARERRNNRDALRTQLQAASFVRSKVSAEKIDRTLDKEIKDSIEGFDAHVMSASGLEEDISNRTNMMETDSSNSSFDEIELLRSPRSEIEDEPTTNSIVDGSKIASHKDKERDRVLPVVSNPEAGTRMGIPLPSSPPPPPPPPQLSRPMNRKEDLSILPVAAVHLLNSHDDHKCTYHGDNNVGGKADGQEEDLGAKEITTKSKFSLMRGVKPPTTVQSLDSRDDQNCSYQGDLKVGGNEGVQDLGAEEQRKKNKFSLMRGLKLKAIRASSPAKARYGSTVSAHEREQRSMGRQVGKIRNLFELIGQDDNSHHIVSSQSVVIGGESSRRSKSERASRSVNISLKGYRHHSDDAKAVGTNGDSFSEHIRSSIRRKKNPLFTGAINGKPSLALTAGEGGADPKAPTATMQKAPHGHPNKQDEKMKQDGPMNLLSDGGSDGVSSSTGVVRDSRSNVQNLVTSPDSGHSGERLKVQMYPTHKDNSAIDGGAAESEADKYSSLDNTPEQDENDNSSNGTTPNVSTKSKSEAQYQYRLDIRAKKAAYLSSCTQDHAQIHTEKMPTPTVTTPKTPIDVTQCRSAFRDKKPSSMSSLLLQHQDDDDSEKVDPSPNAESPSISAASSSSVHSLRTSFSTDSQKLREVGRRNSSATPTGGASSSRRAHTVAVLKARRARRQSGD